MNELRHRRSGFEQLITIARIRAAFPAAVIPAAATDMPPSRPTPRSVWGPGPRSLDGYEGSNELDIACFWVRGAVEDFSVVLGGVADIPPAALVAAADRIAPGVAYEMETVTTAALALRRSTLAPDADPVIAAADTGLLDRLVTTKDALLRWCDKLVPGRLWEMPWHKWCLPARLAAEAFDYTGELGTPFWVAGLTPVQTVVVVLAHVKESSRLKIADLVRLGGGHMTHQGVSKHLTLARVKFDRVAEYSQPWFDFVARQQEEDTPGWSEQVAALMSMVPGGQRLGTTDHLGRRPIDGATNDALASLWAVQDDDGTYSGRRGHVERLSRWRQYSLGLCSLPPKWIRRPRGDNDTGLAGEQDLATWFDPRSLPKPTTAMRWDATSGTMVADSTD